MSEIIKLKLSQIVADPNQPRKFFDETKLLELADSIRTNGILQEPTVRLFGKKYMIVMGERRFRAAELAGLKTIDVKVVDVAEENILQQQIIENLHRDDVQPVEEATAFKQLRDTGKSCEDIALLVGKSSSFVLKRLKLAELVTDAQELLFYKVLDFSTALRLARLDKDAQDTVIAYYREENDGKKLKDWNVNYIDRKIAKGEKSLVNASFSLTSKTLFPQAGACTTCPFNTGNSKLNFDDDDSNKMCTKLSCFLIKESAHIEKVINEAKKEEVLFVIKDDSYLRGKEIENVAVAEKLGVVPVKVGYSGIDLEMPDALQSKKEYFKDNMIDDSDQEEVEEAEQDYKNYVADYEKEVSVYEEAKTSGKYKVAMQLDDEELKEVLIKKNSPVLKKSVVKVDDSKNDEPTGEDEVNKLRTKEIRNQELDGEKIWKLIVPAAKREENISTILNEQPLTQVEMGALAKVLLHCLDYTHRNLFCDTIDIETKTIEPSTFNKLARAAILDKLISVSWGSHFVQGTDNQFAYEVLKQYIPTDIEEIETEQQTKIDKRIERLQGKIANLVKEEEVSF